MSASLNGRAVLNHQLVYFDEIGYDQSDGLVCDGHASKICCRDDHPTSRGGRNGVQSNGVGSWIYPDGSYVRYPCNDSCDDVQKDTFELQRTPNTIILYRNKGPEVAGLLSGIYRCIVPLSIMSDESENLTQYIGIYEKGKGICMCIVCSYVCSHCV